MSQSTQTATKYATFDEVKQTAESQSKFIKVQPGQTVVLKFLKTPEGNQRMQVIEKEFEGRKSKAIKYDVLNINDGQEKVLELSLSWALNLNAILQEGFDVIKITRTGSGLQTSYGFAPTK
jgi:hypothetical protein